MKRVPLLSITALIWLLGMNVWAASNDESTDPNYVLPDVLTCADGTHVSSIMDWEQKRRPELLNIFFSQEYGYTPQGTVDVSYELLAEKTDAIDGLATAQQVMFTFKGQGKEVKALALVYIPNNRKGTVPVFIGYNFQGNHNTTTDEWVRYSPYFERLSPSDPLLGRGAQVSRWPVKDIVHRGYAVMTMCYHDIFPDNSNGEAQSIIPLFPTTDEADSRWKAIGAWAWGCSRMADWVELQSWANKDQLNVIGHSRLGKTALWAGAQDKRFKVVISNNSGCGGAALSKRKSGETVSAITSSFPHWFCKNFSKYSNREQEMPFDQHELLALVAPRHLYVASAQDDSWADPKGEYLSAYHTSPVFELYGMTGLTSPDQPAVNQPVMNDVGYHIRTGGHGITSYDWGNYLDFCDKVYGRKTHHQYKDGICEVCGEADPDYKQPNADGFYEIATAADLNWFAVTVTNGNTDINAVLTADIDDYTGTMIGTAEVMYGGTFDGQYHKITYSTEPTEPRWSLFRTLTGTIRNLNVAGTIITAEKQVGGLVGFIYGGTVENCVCSVEISSSFSGDAGMGGFAATSMTTGSTFKNCIFTGKIQGSSANNCGGILGWITGTANATLTNCLNIGEITVSSNGGNVLVRNPGRATITNCFYQNTYGSVPSGVTQVNETQLASGEICFLLNGDQSTIQWTQKVGDEAYPKPFPTGSRVYGNPAGGFRCNGTPIGETTYSNEYAGVSVPPHTYEAGVCRVCGQIDHNYKQPNADGAYEISTAEDLQWFAAMVASGESAINAVLTNDIDNYEGPMIGTYAGTFDGQYHKITYTTEAAELVWGLFRVLSGTVCNLYVAGTLHTGVNECGGIVGDLYAGTIANCVCTVDIMSDYNGDSAYGGLVSRTMQAGGIISNCVFAGTIQGSGAHSCGGLIGWTNTATTISNCLNIGTITARTNNGDVIARNPNNATRINCYYLNAYGAIPSDVTQVSEAQLASGEVCFRLNGGKYTDVEWTQWIGDEAYPVPTKDHGTVYNINKVYGNAYSASSFQDFQNEVLAAEDEYIQSVVAQISLVEEYETAVTSRLTANTIEEMMAAWEAIKPLYQAVLESAEAYAAYKAKVEEVTAALKENENLQNVKRDALEYYLTESADPSNDYPNGTAPYILEVRELTTEGIKAETAKIDAMYTEALTFEPASGTDITKLLTNPDFSEGWQGWQGTPGTSYGSSSSSPIRAAECWNSTMDMYQTLTGLANGIYELQVNGAFRPYLGAEDLYNTNYAATLYANGVQNYFQTGIEDVLPAGDAIDGYNCNITGDVADFVLTDDEGNALGYIPHDIVGCCNAFRVNRYFNAVLCEVTDGTLTIGIRQPGTGHQPEWLGFGNIKLIYHGTMDEAGEGLDRVLQSQSARANTLVNNYNFSSGADYASYPNFPQALKDELTATMEAAENATEPSAKYALVEKFSDLFQQVYEAKKAYILLMDQTEKLYELAGSVNEFLNEEQRNDLNALIDRLIVMYEDGTASVEDAQKDYLDELPFLPKQVDGVYQIGTALDLAMFATMVTSGTTDIDAVLTADIDGYTGPVIGTAEIMYGGTFDGQYHKINYSTEPTEPRWSLFRTLTGTIRNLHVDGTIVTTQKQVGGLVGFIYGGTIENCVCSVEISSSFSGDAGMGGFAATSMETGSTFTNCIFTGKIEGASANNCGGILGWITGTASAILTNCLNIGEITVGTSGGNVLTRNPGRATITNCYYQNAYASVPGGVTQVGEEQVKSGEICFLLNSDKDVAQWTQKIGEEDYPKPFPTGASVYAVPTEGFRCDGTPLGETTYSNTEPSIAVPQHTYENGICQVCGQVDHDYKQLNADGAYEIATAIDLNWFAAMVNSGENAINAVLTADIDNYTGAMIGTIPVKYAGTFDGQYHKITYTTEAAEPVWGLFRVLSGTVKNLHADGTITSNVNECGGIAGDLYAGTIQNCICTVDILSTYNGDSAYGGLVSRTMQDGCTISDCLFAGTIQGSGAHSCGGLIGWTNVTTSITNCLNIGSITTGENSGNVLARNPGKATITNCYYQKAYGSVPGGVTQVNEDMLKSGEVCFLLNGDQTNIQWTQKLGEEEYPTPFPGSLVLKADDGTFYNFVDAIQQITDEESPVRTDIYDLQGRRLNTVPQNGIYIRGGKKVFLKK